MILSEQRPYLGEVTHAMAHALARNTKTLTSISGGKRTYVDRRVARTQEQASRRNFKIRLGKSQHKILAWNTTDSSSQSEYL